MATSPVLLLSHINLYTASGIVLIIFIVMSILSQQFRGGCDSYLMICIFVWIAFFGYEVKTGHNVYEAFTRPSQSQIEAAKYEEGYVNGRLLKWNKETGEIVKN